MLLQLLIVVQYSPLRIYCLKLGLRWFQVTLKPVSNQLFLDDYRIAQILHHLVPCVTFTENEFPALSSSTRF